MGIVNFLGVKRFVQGIRILSVPWFRDPKSRTGEDGCVSSLCGMPDVYKLHQHLLLLPRMVSGLYTDTC